MRRFASLFKRNDKSDSTTTPSAPTDPRVNRPVKPPSVKRQARFLKSLSVKSVKPTAIREPPHPVSQHPLQVSSFSTSSTDSPAPATPDDDSELVPSISHRSSNQWSERKLTLPLPAAGGSLGWDPLQKPSLSIPPVPTIAKSSGSEESDELSSTATSPLSVSSPLPVSSHKPLHSFTTYALAPSFSIPPLVHLPNVPLFPRSSNSISSLPNQETLATTLHRTQILRRLDSRDLTVSEERSIASFTSRRPLPAKSPCLLSKIDDGPVCDPKRVSDASQGLKRWISRPCFEDRMSVYIPGPSGRPGDIVERNVSGGTLGVAALEVSETIEILAGYCAEVQPEIPWLPTLSSSTTDLPLSKPGKHPEPLRAKP